MEFSPEIVGLGVFGALLIIKEVRHWTTPILMKDKDKANGNRNGLSQRVTANETNIGNLKEGMADIKKENSKEHDEIKALIRHEGGK